MNIINVADLINPDTGNTYRQDNLAKNHSIPIGALVEIVSDGDEDRWDGVRLYVVHHHRDCDGTPLYAMSYDRTNTVLHDPRFHNPDWLHGFPESAIRCVS